MLGLTRFKKPAGLAVADLFGQPGSRMAEFERMPATSSSAIVGQVLDLVLFLISRNKTPSLL